METIPNRASDAGPVADETPLKWRDHTEEARCELDWADSHRSYHDDLKVEREIRVLRLRNAIDEINKAIELLLAGER